MLTQEQLQPIAQLVEHYERLSDADRRHYSETETRTNFIDRLFLALGWPVYDRDHVERETTVAEGKRPDYIFKLHGLPRLFLEAKPLRDDIYNLQYARDAITKALNKGVPWAGLTNFAALVIFDAQEELRPGAPPARVLDLTYSDYLRPDSGLHYLTREALDQRLLEQQAQRTGTRPRAVPIEKRLYESMRQWRELLFNHMRAALDWKTDAQLRTGDEAIQRLIDRLIFLRNCEDRDIGTTDLRALLHRIRSRDRNVRATDSLLRLFAEAAATYDSELFQTDALIDVLLQGLATRTDVDDALAGIVEGLYSVPRSYAQYDFAQMDADVLGQVYEQYLGYVPQYMRQLAAQKPLPGQPAREIAVEAKHQRRKERGIYYTPRWVVRYIVQQTLGRFLDENRHNEDAIANVTILDPACGSGSFLIHAYETLLEHHAARMGGDVGHLDTPTREWILTHNIFGVDLDPQAVEIARLNLLIRMVRQPELLPALKDNIRLGNSLISGAEAELRPYFGDAWQDKRPFDWEQEFPEIMARGGFDVVIGNPPWVFTREGDFGEPAKQFFLKRYVGAKGKLNLYALFIWRGLTLLKSDGLCSMIVPNTFLRATTYEDLRREVMGRYRIEEITDVGPDVFPGVTASTVIPVIKKAQPSPSIQIKALDRTGNARQINLLERARVLATSAAVLDLYADAAVNQIADKMLAISHPLSACTQHLISGIQTWKQHKSNFIASTPLTEDYKPLLEGKDIGRYALNFANKYILYDKKVLNVMQNESIFLLNEKILIQRVSGGPQPLRATLDRHSYYTFNSINTLVCRGLDNRYVLGLLNSTLVNWFYYNKFSNRSSLTVNIATKFLRQLPIRRIDFTNQQEKATHDCLVALVDRMLGLHLRLAAKGDLHDNEREQIEREIGHTDREIDALVYDLYGLTTEERTLIEAEVKR